MGYVIRVENHMLAHMAAENSPHVLADEVRAHPSTLHELVAELAADHAVLVPRRRRRKQRIARGRGWQFDGIKFSQIQRSAVIVTT